MSREKSSVGYVMDLLKVLNKGDSFYTDSIPTTATSYAQTYGVKIRTAKILIVEDHLGIDPKARFITKVTILENGKGNISKRSTNKQSQIDEIIYLKQKIDKLIESFEMDE
jgi:hypothetical protein